MTKWQQFTGVPFWITATAACAVAGSAIVVMAHLISTSYASASDTHALPEAKVAEEDAGHARDASLPSPLRVVGHRRKSCTGCGVVESVRMIPGVVDAGEPDRADAGVAGARANTANARYEYTVRSRDGTKTLFNESTPRSWRAGSRVIVIDGAHASTH